MEMTSISNETQSSIRMLMNSTKAVAIMYLSIKLIKYLMSFILKLIENARGVVLTLIIVTMLMIVLDETMKLQTLEKALGLLQKIV